MLVIDVFLQHPYIVPSHPPIIVSVTFTQFVQFSLHIVVLSGQHPYIVPSHPPIIVSVTFTQFVQFSLHCCVVWAAPIHCAFTPTNKCMLDRNTITNSDV